MKYLCLVYLDAERWTLQRRRVRRLCRASSRPAGACSPAEPLHPVHTATTVRVRNGEVMLFDGPFAETKEMLAGFYLVDARDLNEAIEIAARIPPARHGSVEVRPVRELQAGAGA